MKQIQVKFLRFDSQGVSKPIFIDNEGNEYHWPSCNIDPIDGAHKGFWDELGCNEKLTYKILFEDEGGIKIVTNILGYK